MSVSVSACDDMSHKWRKLRSCVLSLLPPRVSSRLPGAMAMSKEISVGFADMQVVLKAKCNAFCRCGKTDDTSCEGVVCDCTRSFSIPADCLKQVAGNFFVQLSRSNNSIRRLMCCLALSTERENDDTIFKVLGKTTIIDDLVREKQIALRMQAANCSRSKAESFRKRWHRNKKFEGKLAAVPEVVTVMAPSVGDIPSCELKMLSSSFKTKGPKSVVIEINSQSLTWLASAIDWQYRNCNVESGYVQAREKKRQRSDVDGEVANSESDSGSSDSGPSEQSGEGQSGGDDVKQAEDATEEHGGGQAGADPAQAVDLAQDAAVTAESASVDLAQDAAATAESASEGPAAVRPPVAEAAPQPTRPSAPKAPPARQLTLRAMFARK